MKYDFTTILYRKGMDAEALDLEDEFFPRDEGCDREKYDFIPMWVADMNFPVFPGITEAITKRISHPCFGYFGPRQEYFDAIINWQKIRNGVEGLEKEHIGYENGVLGGVISALNTMCSKGSAVLVHSPTYIGFNECLENNGYKIVRSPLVKDGDGVWRMDVSDMEKKIVENKIHAAIMCSPHNPTGRVWTREELETAMDLFKKYDVKVVSDEIWSDIILPGHKHIPTQSISEDAKNRTVALYAPSKTFSLAGLVGSYHVIYNKTLRDRHEKESSLSCYNAVNVLSMHALIGAYCKEGMEWTDELCQVIQNNVKYAYDFISEKFKGIEVSMPQGTYMMFLDCTKWCENHGETLDGLLKKGWNVGVGWQDGRPFCGKCHIRLNLASPFSRIKEAFDRLDKALNG
ncbi:MAG: aminotransferase class I/II-fold pyridoxal phosphate-dependent enzyme [Clostridia bacterium]|nr:aminotransferase class I/II-fold pyridoxal phosphate-dependent enzyme [Clostridia bacterium]